MRNRGRATVTWLAGALAVFAIGWFALRHEPAASDVEKATNSRAAPAPVAATGSDAVTEAVAQRPARAETPLQPAKWPRFPVDNPFDFIRGLAKAAYEGDGEAQYRISKELDKCEMTLSFVRKVSDPEATIWGLSAGWTQSMKERTFSEYQRCRRLLQEDPFAELPKRPGGYKFTYWMARATESGQPLALLEKSLSSGLMLPGDPLKTGMTQAEARETIVKALLSGNPEAQLMVGSRLYGSEDAERNIGGAAWLLAGCRAGADCSFENSIMPIWMCFDGGDERCQPGLDVETLLSRALTPDQYARAFARYERISAAMSARDIDAINAELGF